MKALCNFYMLNFTKLRLNHKKREISLFVGAIAPSIVTIDSTKKTIERKFLMHSITQLNLFADNELGDLVKLNTVLNELPDQELINALDEERPTGRDDYSNLSMWRTLIAKFVFQHSTIESLIRELNRNSNYVRHVVFNRITY